MDLVPADADARRHALIRFISTLVFALLFVPAHVNADGGAIQFTKKAGPFTVTLFSAPVPLRVGVCDLSVMMQRSADGSPVLDGEVGIAAIKPGTTAISAIATREKATNKLLYAANVNFPENGRWTVQIRAKRGTEVGLASGELTVFDAQLKAIAYWPYFTPVPLGIVLFVLNQWLKKQRRLNRRTGSQ